MDNRQAALDLASKYVLLSERIRPVMKFAMDHDGVVKKSDVGEFWYIEPKEDIFTKCFSWGSVPTSKTENLSVAGVINTHHSYNYPLNFKPTIAEVMSFINEMNPPVADNIVAFSLEFVGSAYEDVHRAKATLYSN